MTPKRPLIVAALLLVSLALAAVSSAERDEQTDAGGGVFEKRTHPPTAGQLAERAYREALRLEGRGQQEAARQRLGEILDLAPDHRGARLALATLLAQRGQLGEAKRLLAVGLEAEPGHAPFAKLQARILVAMDAVGQAVALLERVAPPLPADPDHHAFLAALYQRQGRHDRAVQLYGQVLQLVPRSASWWMGLAISLEAVGRPEQALAAYRGTQRVGGLDPTSQRFVEERIEGLAGTHSVRRPTGSGRRPGAG